MTPPHFASTDYARIKGHGDRAVVLSDHDLSDGGASLIGQTIDIDGAAYLVLKVDGKRGLLRKGEQMVLWVERAE